MAANVVMTIVMAVTMDANADTDATNMNADDGGVRRACTQQGEGKNRGDKGFHNESFSRNASSASFAVSAWMACRCYGKLEAGLSFQIVQFGNIPSAEEMQWQPPELPGMHCRTTRSNPRPA